MITEKQSREFLTRYEILTPEMVNIKIPLAIDSSRVTVWYAIIKSALIAGTSLAPMRSSIHLNQKNPRSNWMGIWTIMMLLPISSKIRRRKFIVRWSPSRNRTRCCSNWLIRTDTAMIWNRSRISVKRAMIPQEAIKVASLEIFTQATYPSFPSVKNNDRTPWR